jgi:KaiC/GvpD/RAD55 family RecA-like ATPase
MAKEDKKRYGFTKEFEGAVVLAMVSLPRFYERAGYAVDPVAMSCGEAAKLVMAAQAVSVRNGGGGCSSSLFAIQHLKSLHVDGKLTIEELEECSDYLDWAEAEVSLPGVEEMVIEVSPYLKKAGFRAALEQAIDTFGKSSDPDPEDVAEAFNKAARIGRKGNGLGMRLLGTEDQILAAVRTFTEGRLPTGIYELDEALRGGLEKNAMGMVVAPSGAGKSLFLVHVAVEALIRKLNVCYVTLELSEAQVSQRIFANLTDMTKEEMAEDISEAAHRMLEHRMDGVGDLRVLYQTPQATTPGHIRAWLKDLEREDGFIPALLVVDYADKMVHSLTGSNERNTYKDAELVYEELRTIMVDRDGRVWTASQANKEALHKSRVTQKHTADSQMKNRVVDIAIGLARTAEDEANGQVRFRVNKRRDDEGFQEIGPIDWDAARGRIAMVFNRINPW